MGLDGCRLPGNYLFELFLSAPGRGCVCSEVSAPGGVCSLGGVSALREGVWSGGCLLPGVVCSLGGLVETPPQDGHCCGWYASYWNAFLF